MLTLAQFHLPLLALCFAIGLATAWWMFRHRRR